MSAGQTGSMTNCSRSFSTFGAECLHCPMEVERFTADVHSNWAPECGTHYYIYLQEFAGITHTRIFFQLDEQDEVCDGSFFLARSWTVCGSCQYEDQSAPKGWRGIFQAQLFPWPTLGANQWKDARLHHKGLVHLMVHKFANLKNVIISVKETSCFYGQGDRVLPTGSPAGSKQAKR